MRGVGGCSSAAGVRRGQRVSWAWCGRGHRARALAQTRYQNFGEGVSELGNLVPAVGKVTIAMLERNLLRLHANFHVPSPRRRALVRGALLAAAAGAVGVALLAARARRSR